jgi:hypothetical protein
MKLPLLLLALAVPYAAQAADDYHLRREVPVPGGNSGWDYLNYQADTGRLFVGHRLEGLQVFDVAHDFKMTAVDQTRRSNGAMLMPEFGLGVSHNGDGTLTVFKLSDLSVQKRVTVGSDLDSSRYDPVTKHLITLGVPTADDKGTAVGVYGLPDFAKLATIDVDSDSLENSAADGQGDILVSAQDRDAVYRIDLRQNKVTAQWPTTGCTQPVGLAYDSADHRIMVGCRGHLTAPKFLVMNADTGAVVFTAPIGAGNDGVVYDAARHRVVLTCGIAANMAVFDQSGADAYKLAEVVGTRANVRTLALNPDTGDIYTDYAEGIYDASKKNLAKVAPFYPNTFTPGSFRILVYGK